MTNITPVRGGGNLCHVETGGPGAAGDGGRHDRMRATVFFLPDSKVRMELATAGLVAPPVAICGAPPPAGAGEGLQPGSDPPPARES